MEKKLQTVEDYHNRILSLCASATLADHMGDMWDDIYKVLGEMGEKELVDADFDEMPKLLHKRGIQTVWGTDIGNEE